MVALVPPEIKRFFYPRIIKVEGVRAFAISKPLKDMPRTDNATTMMAEIIRKTLLVSIFILISTTANLALFVRYQGTEHAWLVFLMCSLDVTWSLSCLTYLIGLPTDHETPNENDYTLRETNFVASNLDLAPQIPSLQAISTEYVPSEIIKRTEAWAMTSGSAGTPQNYEMDVLGAAGPVFRRDGGGVRDVGGHGGDQYRVGIE